MTSVSSPITVYWRPGCFFCASLRRKLDRSDLTYREVNIWDDPDAAATVRAYAAGNETVPTVVIGEALAADAIGLVNPSLREVQAAVERHGRGGG